MDARAALAGKPILTATAMRAADAAAIAAGSSGRTLMERAGAAVARAVIGFAGPAPVLVLCGPGNNGGDGYVVARLLRERGWPVRVARFDEPRSADARAAAACWTGPVEPAESAAPAPIFIDALFGTGLARGLDEVASVVLGRLAAGARHRIAVDLPSGVDSDEGRLLGCCYAADLTVALAAPKPAHLLFPAARLMGRVVVADIGIAVTSRWQGIAPPRLKAPGPGDHKYRRGHVLVVEGDMPGASHLAAAAAGRSGAGYVTLVGAGPPLDAATVLRSRDAAPGLYGNVGAIVIGPGLTGGDAGLLLRDALESGRPLVLDAGILTHVSPHFDAFGARNVILTPHEGEFERVFGTVSGSRIDRALAAAARSGAVLLLKGADTVIASPDGRVGVATSTSFWLSTAGTGDVLSGICGAMLARGLDAFEAACAAVWLQTRAAMAAGPAFIADDLLGQLPGAVGSVAR